MNIDITNKASEKLKNILEEKNTPSAKVRIFLAGIGWGGPRFNLALDEQKENDKNYSEDGIHIIADKNLIEQFKGFKIDYSNFFLMKGFSIYPHAGSASSC